MSFKNKYKTIKNFDIPLYRLTLISIFSKNCNKCWPNWCVKNCRSAIILLQSLGCLRISCKIRNKHTFFIIILIIKKMYFNYLSKIMISFNYLQKLFVFLLWLVLICRFHIVIYVRCFQFRYRWWIEIWLAYYFVDLL